MIEIESATGRTPQALFDEPTLYGSCKELAIAFNMLAGRRTAGLAPNPIPLSEISAYLDRFGPPSVPEDVFIQLLSEMDLAYLEVKDGNKSTGSS